jgi:hypothetical protein
MNLLFPLVLALVPYLTATRKDETQSVPTGCATCHRKISETYAKSAMSRTSGHAAENLMPGDYQNKDSGVRYRVFERNGRAWMSYARDGKNSIRGQNELIHFIGAGKTQTQYLFAQDGFWFQAPVHFDSAQNRWELSPGQRDAEEIPLNVPASVSCVNCHASAVQEPDPGTDNKFSAQPFLHAGITCERCHGSGEQHAAGKGTIVNPAKLPAERRDSICMECHFQGVVAVLQPGKHMYHFQPGDRLSDYAHYFLLPADPKLETPQALSQYEALSQSVCKRRSGEKMWCGSCHDAHGEPSADEKAAYYRGKCLGCHGENFAQKHYPEKPDCRGCHMPALSSIEMTHTEKTDHRIMRFPTPTPVPQLLTRGKPLTPFPARDEPPVTNRDYALAWVKLAQRGVEGAADEAQKYLREAVKEQPNDAELLTALGYIEQEHKHDDEARELYGHALEINHLNNDAATNLGMVEARTGNLKHAVELWQEVFQRAPYRSTVGLNVAIAFCLAGQKDVARQFVQRVLQFNPDSGKAKSLMTNMKNEPSQCKP